MDDEVEASPQRVRDHLRRPLAGSRDLLLENAGNTVNEIVPFGLQVAVHGIVVPAFDRGKVAAAPQTIAEQNPGAVKQDDVYWTHDGEGDASRGG